MDHIKATVAKAQNRRIIIALYKDDNGGFVVRVITKRLLDRKKREIAYHEVFYTPETLSALTNLFSHTTSSDFWHKEVVLKMEKIVWQANTDLNYLQ